MTNMFDRVEYICQQVKVSGASNDIGQQRYAEFRARLRSRSLKIWRLRTGEKLNVRPLSRFYYFINRKKEES